MSPARRAALDGEVLALFNGVLPLRLSAIPELRTIYR
jgi:hypothetical protein